MSTALRFSDYPVVVGIDFGTTYSGVAFAIASPDAEIQDITRWPKQSQFLYPKAPTISMYNLENRSLVAWGNAARVNRNRPQTRSNHVLLKQYKLYLDENLNGVFTPLPAGLRPVDVIADYLREFHSYFVSQMRQTYAQRYEGRFRYCITVPAMWTDKAKQTMRDAAIQAGLIESTDHPDRLMLTSEPEAAAIYCEKTCEHFDMNDGDEFMICDAGGGTVDLIVFSVKMDQDGTRRFRETTKGLGKSCGSMFIDKKMRKLLKSKLKGVADLPAAAMETIMDHFTDTLKPVFDGTEDLYLPLPVTAGLTTSNEPSIGLEDGVMTFKAEEMRNLVFEPVVKDVIELVHKQKQQAHNLKAIFMVGGFGASLYLFNRISEEFSSSGIRVIIPNRPEMAVSRGAVYYGLNPKKVAGRIPRYWYGIDITDTFVEGRDPPDYRVVRADGSVRCDNRFSTFVRRGEPLSIDACVEQKYSTIYPRHTACTFYAASTEEEPRYTLQPGVHKVFDFEIPMPTLPDVMPGQTVQLTIKMYFGEVELRVEAVIRDQTYRVVCNFDV